LPCRNIFLLFHDCLPLLVYDCLMANRQREFMIQLVDRFNIPSLLHSVLIQFLHAQGIICLKFIQKSNLFPTCPYPVINLVLLVLSVTKHIPILNFHHSRKVQLLCFLLSSHSIIHNHFLLFRLSRSTSFL